LRLHFLKLQEVHLLSYNMGLLSYISLLLGCLFFIAG
jgi:hypothetical protein